MGRLQSKLYLGDNVNDIKTPQEKNIKAIKHKEHKIKPLKMDGVAYLNALIGPEEDIKIKKSDLLNAIQSYKNILEESRANVKVSFSPELQKDISFMFQQLIKFKGLSSRKTRQTNKETNRPLKAIEREIEQIEERTQMKYNPNTVGLDWSPEEDARRLEGLIQEMEDILGINMT